MERVTPIDPRREKPSLHLITRNRRTEEEHGWCQPLRCRFTTCPSSVPTRRLAFLINTASLAPRRYTGDTSATLSYNALHRLMVSPRDFTIEYRYSISRPL